MEKKAKLRNKPITKNTLLLETVRNYLHEIDPNAPNRPSPAEIEEVLLYRIDFNVSVQHNAVSEKEKRWRIPVTLPPAVIGEILLYFENFKCVRQLEEEEDTYELMCYQTEGEKKGLYTANEDEFEKKIVEFNCSMTKRERQEVLSYIRLKADKCCITRSPNLVPVRNGIFDLETKQLMPFSPDYVYVCKYPVDYVENPANVVIRNDSDGTDWDVESWISSLSDDSEIVKLLWEVIAAAMRSNVSYHKVVCLYSTIGNNGKGTFLQFVRNLCGAGNTANISLHNFSQDFMLESLPHSLAVLADENPVETFTKLTDLVKSVITGDTVKINRKHKKAVSYQFRGLMVQCLNELPHFADKSEALYRRFLIVPFEKCFTGCERTYIKQDYLGRKEVLEYVMHKALHMDFKEFSNPAACQELLDRFKTSNDPVRDFLDTMLDKTVWNLLPNEFLYDLYKSWFRQVNPSGCVLGRNKFLERVRDAINAPNSDYAGRWMVSKCQVRLEADKPERLIASYNLDAWKNPLCTNADVNRLCMTPHHGGMFRGLVRL